jgi:hypothetical protein
MGKFSKVVSKLKIGPKLGDIKTVEGVQFRYVGKQFERVYLRKVDFWRCRVCLVDFESADLAHHAGYEVRSRDYEAERSRLLNEAYDAQIQRGNAK